MDFARNRNLERLAVHESHPEHRSISAISPQHAGDSVSWRRTSAEDFTEQCSGDAATGVMAKKTTDEQIVDAAYFALNCSGYGQLRNVLVDCINGRVILRGRVPTYYLKQVAQSTICRINGVCGIDNDLQVVALR
jgi:osmotically-inducible protein OsmY